MKFEKPAASDVDQCSPAPGDAQALVSALIRRHPANVPFSAEEIVKQNPELLEHRSCLIDLAYEEFCRLREAGDNITATQFAGRYRDIEH